MNIFILFMVSSCLSVCLLVFPPVFKFNHITIVLSLKDRDFIFDMYILLMEHFQSTIGVIQPQSCSFQLSLSQCLDCVMVFANSHLMMSHTNKLVVIAAHTNERFV